MAEEKKNIKSEYSPNPNSKEFKLLERVYTRYYQMKDSRMRQDAEKSWKRSRDQWEALRKEKSEDEWQSNHYVPMTTAVVETALSEVIDQSPKPLILPRGSEDAPKAQLMSHVFDYTWDISDSDLEFEEIIHDAFIYGTGIGQEYYYRDVRRIQKSGKDDQLKEEEATDYEDCYLESVPLEEFYIDEAARGFRGPYGARDCIRRYSMHIDDFKNFYKGNIWDPLGNAKYVVPGGSSDFYEFYRPDPATQGDYVEVLWYWSVKPDDWLIICANDVVILMGPNPYKHKQLPFARAVDVKRTHQFYGKGESELLESIQDEVNTIRRMTIDRAHLDIDKMFYGTSRVNLSDEDLIARPHGFIPSEEEIKPVEYNDTPRSVEITLQHLDDDATIATGINPRAQALPTTGTATEAAILKESTLKRIRLKVRRFEREFLTRVARLRVANILQFYPQPKLEKIVGEAATKQYEEEIAQLEQRGIKETDNVVKMGSDLYVKKFRDIRMEDKEINFDAKGNLREKNSQGIHFFKLKPEYFLPNQGGYDIKFKAGSSLPISEPLMQSKASEMYDRLVQLALAGVGYDPIKLGDMLLRVNHYNPNDFHVQDPQQQEDTARIQAQIELANVENGLIMQGKPVPSTAYVSSIHTQVHVEFTGSPTFQQLTKDDPRVQIMLDHIAGEMAAQQDRLGAPAQQNGQLPTQPQQGPTTGTNAEILPDRIQGGEQVPQAI